MLCRSLATLLVACVIDNDDLLFDCVTNVVGAELAPIFPEIANVAEAVNHDDTTALAAALSSGNTAFATKVLALGVAVDREPFNRNLSLNIRESTKKRIRLDVRHERANLTLPYNLCLAARSLTSRITHSSSEADGDSVVQFICEKVLTPFAAQGLKLPVVVSFLALLRLPFCKLPALCRQWYLEIEDASLICNGSLFTQVFSGAIQVTRLQDQTQHPVQLVVRDSGRSAAGLIPLSKSILTLICATRRITETQLDLLVLLSAPREARERFLSWIADTSAADFSSTTTWPTGLDDYTHHSLLLSAPSLCRFYSSIKQRASHGCDSDDDVLDRFARTILHKRKSTAQERRQPASSAGMVNALTEIPDNPLEVLAASLRTPLSAPWIRTVEFWARELVLSTDEEGSIASDVVRQRARHKEVCALLELLPVASMHKLVEEVWSIARRQRSSPFICLIGALLLVKKSEVWDASFAGKMALAAVAICPLVTSQVVRRFSRPWSSVWQQVDKSSEEDSLLTRRWLSHPSNWLNPDFTDGALSHSAEFSLSLAQRFKEKECVIVCATALGSLWTDYNIQAMFDHLALESTYELLSTVLDAVANPLLGLVSGAAVALRRARARELLARVAAMASERLSVVQWTALLRRSTTYTVKDDVAIHSVASAAYRRLTALSDRLDDPRLPYPEIWLQPPAARRQSRNKTGTSGEGMFPEHGLAMDALCLGNAAQLLVMSQQAAALRDEDEEGIASLAASIQLVQDQGLRPALGFSNTQLTKEATVMHCVSIAGRLLRNQSSSTIRAPEHATTRKASARYLLDAVRPLVESLGFEIGNAIASKPLDGDALLSDVKLDAFAAGSIFANQTVRLAEIILRHGDSSRGACHDCSLIARCVTRLADMACNSRVVPDNVIGEFVQSLFRASPKRISPLVQFFLVVSRGRPSLQGVMKEWIERSHVLDGAVARADTHSIPDLHLLAKSLEAPFAQHTVIMWPSETLPPGISRSSAVLQASGVSVETMRPFVSDDDDDDEGQQGEATELRDRLSNAQRRALAAATHIQDEEDRLSSPELVHRTVLQHLAHQLDTDKDWPSLLRLSLYPSVLQSFSHCPELVASLDVPVVLRDIIITTRELFAQGSALAAENTAPSGTLKFSFIRDALSKDQLDALQAIRSCQLDVELREKLQGEPSLSWTSQMSNSNDGNDQEGRRIRITLFTDINRNNTSSGDPPDESECVLVSLRRSLDELCSCFSYQKGRGALVPVIRMHAVDMWQEERDEFKSVVDRIREQLTAVPRELHRIFEHQQEFSEDAVWGRVAFSPNLRRTLLNCSASVSSLLSSFLIRTIADSTNKKKATLNNVVSKPLRDVIENLVAEGNCPHNSLDFLLSFLLSNCDPGEATCAVCYCPLDKPVLLQCRHIVCYSCLLQMQKTNARACPHCRCETLHLEKTLLVSMSPSKEPARISNKLLLLRTILRDAKLQKRRVGIVVPDEKCQTAIRSHFDMRQASSRELAQFRVFTPANLIQAVPHDLLDVVVVVSPTISLSAASICDMFTFSRTEIHFRPLEVHVLLYNHVAEECVGQALAISPSMLLLRTLFAPPA